MRFLYNLECTGGELRGSVKSLMKHHACQPGCLSYEIAGELKSTALESVGPARMPFCIVGSSVQM